MIESIAKAMGDESRRKILEMLQGKELSASQIFEAFPYTPPTISRHLAVLKEAELVQTRREGVFIYYRIQEQAFKEMQAWLQGFLPKEVKPKTSPSQVRPRAQENPLAKFSSDF